MAPKKKTQRAKPPASTEPVGASAGTRRSARVGSRQPVSTEPPPKRRANRRKPSVESDEEEAGLPSERGKRAQHRTKGSSISGVNDIREPDEETREDSEEEQLELRPERAERTETQDTIYLGQERAPSIYEDAPESSDAAVAVDRTYQEVEHLADLSGTTFGNAARVSGASTQLGDASAAPASNEGPVSNETQLDCLHAMVEALDSLDWSAQRIIKTRTPDDVYNVDTYEAEDVELFYREFNDPKSAASRKTRPARGSFRDALDAIKRVSGSQGAMYIDVRHVVNAFASKFRTQTGVDLSGRLIRAELILYMANLAFFLDDVEALHRPGKAYFILGELMSADAFATLHTINEMFFQQFASGLGHGPGDSEIEGTIDVALSLRVQLFFETLRSVEGEQDFTSEGILQHIFYQEKDKASAKGWASHGLQTKQLTAQDKAKIANKLSTISEYIRTHVGTLAELREDLQNHLGMDPGELRWELVRWASERAQEIRLKLDELPGDTESFKDDLNRQLAAHQKSSANKARPQQKPSTSLPTRNSSVKTGLREEVPAHAAPQRDHETQHSRPSTRANTDKRSNGAKVSGAGAGAGSKDESAGIFAEIEGGLFQGTEEHDDPVEDDFIPQTEGDDDQDPDGMTQQDHDLRKQLGVDKPQPPFALSSQVPIAAESTNVLEERRGARRFNDTQPNARRVSPIRDTQDVDETNEERNQEVANEEDHESEPEFQADTRNVQASKRRNQLTNGQAKSQSQKRGRTDDEAESREASSVKRPRVNQGPQDDLDDQYIGNAGDDQDAANDQEVVEAESRQIIKKVKTSAKHKSNDKLPVRSGRIGFSDEEDEHLLKGIARYHMRHDTMSRILDRNGWDRLGIFKRTGRRNQDLSNRARVLRVAKLMELGIGHEHEMPEGLNSIPLKAVNWARLEKYGFEKPADEVTRRRKAVHVTIPSDEDEDEDEDEDAE